MKYKLLIAVLLGTAFLLPKTSYAMPATDKVAHVGVGYMLNSELKKHTHMTFIERLGVVVVVAGAKELSDAHWDNKDFMATVAGCLVVEIHF